MLKRDRWRLILVAAVIVAGLFAVFPIQGRVRLGLDLKGGAHIVLLAKETAESPLTDDSIDRLIAVLRNRVDQYGVTEPVIQRQGKDRVILDLPGIQDPEAALELIGRTALLEFKEVLQSTAAVPPAPNRPNYASDEDFLAAQSRWQKAKDEVDAVAKELKARVASNPGVSVGRDKDGRAYLLGKTYVVGKDLKDAKTGFDSLSRPMVSLKFSPDGTRLFDEATAGNIGRQIAIVLDGEIISAPVVQERISGGEAQITGRFTVDEANRLAIMLRAGALPVPVEVAENRTVGPTLGSDSIRSGLRAGIIGAILVLIFMLVYYRFLGIAADMALSVALLLVFAGLITFRSTLTLPGIAGIVLTIGMAVDGNILIYERMKEELRSGKTQLAALDAGFRKALTTILDSNLTTLIAAAILFYFGSGPIRGFAVTLSIGIISSVFCNVLVTRVILQSLLDLNRKKALGSN